jgi:hypothetical protein
MSGLEKKRRDGASIRHVCGDRHVRELDLRVAATSGGSKSIEFRGRYAAGSSSIDAATLPAERYAGTRIPSQMV